MQKKKAGGKDDKEIKKIMLEIANRPQGIDMEEEAAAAM